MAPAGRWDFYFCEMDGKHTMVFVRLDLIDDAPDRRRPWLVMLTLKLRSDREDGMSDAPETEFLQSLEDALEREFLEHFDALYVGRNTGGSRRVMVYYASEEVDEAVLDAHISSHAPEYEFETECFRDDEWEGYLDSLYPNEIAWLEIRNRPVLDHLREAGDPLEPERPTSHWIYFKTSGDRGAFIEAVKAKGAEFEVVKVVDPGADSEDYGVVIEHQCSMTTGSLIRAQLPIIHLAREHEGEYDGFECLRCSAE